MYINIHEIFNNIPIYIYIQNKNKFVKFVYDFKLYTKSNEYKYISTVYTYARALPR